MDHKKPQWDTMSLTELLKDKERNSVSRTGLNKPQLVSVNHNDWQWRTKATASNHNYP